MACSVAATAVSQVRRQQRVGVGVWGTSRGVGCGDVREEGWWSDLRLTTYAVLSKRDLGSAAKR